MTANWPMPAGMAGSRRTAARVTRGAICLSSSSHFALKLYSNWMKPVALPPGRARLSTKPPPTGSATVANTIGTVRVACSNGPTVRVAGGQNDVRRERGQFRRVFANVGGIAHGPADVNLHVAAIGPAQLLQRLPERRDAGLRIRIVRGCGRMNTLMRRILRPAAPAPRAAIAAAAPPRSAEKLPPPHVRPKAQDKAS